MECSTGWGQQPQPSSHQGTIQPTPHWSRTAQSSQSAEPDNCNVTQELCPEPLSKPRGCLLQKSPSRRTVAWARNSLKRSVEPWQMSRLQSSVPISCSRAAASPSSQDPSCERAGQGSGGMAMAAVCPQHLPFLPQPGIPAQAQSHTVALNENQSSGNPAILQASVIIKNKGNVTKTLSHGMPQRATSTCGTPGTPSSPCQTQSRALGPCGGTPGVPGNCWIGTRGCEVLPPADYTAPQPTPYQP